MPEGIPRSSILERIPDVFFRLDEEGRVLYLNDAWECWTGIPKGEIEGKLLVDHVPQSECAALKEALDEVREGRDPAKEIALRLPRNEKEDRSFHLFLRREEGTDRSLLIEGLAKKDDPKSGSHEDEAPLPPHSFQEEWAEWSSRLAHFPESAPIPLLASDQDGGIIYLNPVAHRFVNERGREGELDFLPIQHKKLAQHVFRTGKEVEREVDFEGRTFCWSYSFSIGARSVHIWGHDITDQKKVEGELLDVIVRTQEEERERFAKELHEGIGQNLSAVLMHLGDLRTRLTPDQEEIASCMEGVLQQTIQDVRSISHGLMPRLLKEFGLVAALEDLRGRMQKRSGIGFLPEVSIREDHVDDRTKIGVFRVVQELIEFSSHVRKAERCYCGIREEDEELILQFKDAGAEKDPATGGSLTDLRKFNSMVRSMHGRLDLIREEEGKPIVEIRIPLK